MLGAPGPLAQRDDARAAWPWRSAFWSTTRRSRSRTSTATWAWASRCARRFSTARSRSPARRSSRRSRICIVFVSVVFLNGPAKYLFTPLALAVVFAMLASYLLSRTLVPTMVALPAARPRSIATRAQSTAAAPGWFWRCTRAFNARLRARCATRYARRLGVDPARIATASSSSSPPLVVAAARAARRSSAATSSRRSTPASSGCTSARPPGTRLEETERVFSRVEDEHPRDHPEAEIELVLDNIGLPAERHQPGLRRQRHDRHGRRRDPGVAQARPHGARRRSTCASCAASCPGVPRADLLLPAGRHRQPDPELRPARARSTSRSPASTARRTTTIARRSRERIARVPGVEDVHLHQVMNVPKLHVDVDQTRAAELGLTQQDVANSLLVSLSASGQVQPNYWVDPQNGHHLSVAAQTPPYRIDSVEPAARHCRSSPSGQPGAAAPGQRGHRAAAACTPDVANHYNVQPVFDVYANVQGRDLGSVAGDDRTHRGRRAARSSPRATTIVVRGQVESMDAAFSAARPRPRLRRGPGLPADGRELPELARSVHHHHGAAGRVRRASSGCSS